LDWLLPVATPLSSHTYGGAACVEPSVEPISTADLSRTDEQGAVIVVVEPVNLDSPGETLDFEVSLDTHSVDLSTDSGRPGDADHQYRAYRVGGWLGRAQRRASRLRQALLPCQRERHAFDGRSYRANLDTSRSGCAGTCFQMGVSDMNMNSRHTLIMLVCCLIPLAAFAALFVFNVPVDNVLLFTLVLLCPLSHLLMMKSMLNVDDAHHDAHQHIAETRKQHERQGAP
jgi:hypothetical protein